MIRTRKFSGAAAAFGKAPSSGNVCEYCLTRETERTLNDRSLTYLYGSNILAGLFTLVT
jgi:hypothetical protein